MLKLHLRAQPHLAIISKLWLQSPPQLVLRRLYQWQREGEGIEAEICSSIWIFCCLSVGACISIFWLRRKCSLQVNFKETLMTSSSVILNWLLRFSFMWKSFAASLTFSFLQITISIIKSNSIVAHALHNSRPPFKPKNLPPQSPRPKGFKWNIHQHVKKSFAGFFHKHSHSHPLMNMMPFVSWCLRVLSSLLLLFFTFDKSSGTMGSNSRWKRTLNICVFD